MKAKLTKEASDALHSLTIQALECAKRVMQDQERRIKRLEAYLERSGGQ